MRLRVIVVVFFAVCLLTDAYCQGGTVMELGMSPHPKVLVQKPAPMPRVISSNFPILGGVGFYLLNSSEKSIVALAVTWEVESAEGDRKTYKFTSDSFLDIQGHAVVDPDAELFIAPRLWIPVERLSEVSAGFLRARKPGLARTEALFHGARRVSISIDTLVFSDGQVFGPNETMFDRELVDRKQAAGDIVRLVEEAERQGKSGLSELNKLVSTPRFKNDKRAFWKYRFAQQLLHSRDFDANLTYLRSLPEVPLLRKGFIK